MKTKEKEAPPQGTGNAPALIPKKELVLEGDPEAQLAFATKAANALMKVVKPKKINGKDYMMFGGWQTLGRFFGSTVGVEWTKPILNEKGAVVGYEARAEVLQNGQRISSAEASCLRTERNWTSKDEFSLKSMAQTRAAAKALRNAFGWVAELAGLESTPAEEMSYDQTPIKDSAVPTVSYDNPEDEINEIVPSKKKNPVDTYLQQKRQIVDLATKITLVPLVKKEEYEVWVKEQTGLELKQENYPAIIERLEALKV